MPEARCKFCNKLLPPQLKGGREREFCNDVCKMHYYRRAKRKQQEADMEARWSGYLPETQRALSDAYLLRNIDLASRIAAAISSEITEREEEISRLQARLAAIQTVEERFRTDTEARHFKTWLKKRGFHPQGSFAQRFLDDTRLPQHASRSLYEARLRLYRYSVEDIQTFQEYWKAMLIAQS
jgi:hypothetical protein